MSVLGNIPHGFHAISICAQGYHYPSRGISKILSAFVAGDLGFLIFIQISINFLDLKIMKNKPLSPNPTKWSNTVKQLICRQQPTNCLSVFEHFVGLAINRL